MERVIDITSDGLHLGVFRGFLTIHEGQEERGRIALDDIGALITHAHGLTWSNNVFVRLSERNIPVVICAANHAPVTCLWPIAGHHLQGARLRAQAEVSKPVKKQLWQRVVASKIRMQGAVLASTGQEASAFEHLARKVRSGDPGNLEAQAARRYWPQLMGKSFRRDTNAGGENAMLNYGYTVLRAIVSRAICAAGLHPTLGIHHSNQANAFALADDLMEPYRPLIDRTVINLASYGWKEVVPEVKQALAGLAVLDLSTPEGASPLNVQIGRFVHAVAAVFVDNATEYRCPVTASAAPFCAGACKPWSRYFTRSKIADFMTTFYTQRRGAVHDQTRYLSAYRLMWILVTFDLPVESKKQRKAASGFRNFLLDQGFEMSQFSNYIRFCNGKEKFETYSRRIEANLPERGDVFIFQFTDRQYENIIRFSDQGRRKRQKNPGQLVLF